MTRRALFAIPDGATTPAGWTLIGTYTVRPPRRYAVVTDLTAWTDWVREHAPDAIADCGHIDHAFEATVRRWVASHGRFPCPHCATDVAPDGMEARTDSAVRIHVTTPDGSIDSWESPVDVSPEEVPA